MANVLEFPYPSQSRSPPNSNQHVFRKGPVDETNQNDEALAEQPTHATYIDKDQVVNLSQEHHDYLVKRHGTADLDPVPAFGDADPYNWPQWKVCQQSIQVCSHCLSNISR